MKIKNLQIKVYLKGALKIKKKKEYLFWCYLQINILNKYTLLVWTVIFLKDFKIRAKEMLGVIDPLISVEKYISVIWRCSWCCMLEDKFSALHSLTIPEVKHFFRQAWQETQLIQLENWKLPCIVQRNLESLGTWEENDWIKLIYDKFMWV